MIHRNMTIGIACIAAFAAAGQGGDGAHALKLQMFLREELDDVGDALPSGQRQINYHCAECIKSRNNVALHCMGLSQIENTGIVAPCASFEGAWCERGLGQTLHF